MARRIQETPLQILCEGADDAEFFARLTEARGMPEYHTECPKGKDERCLGKGGFKAHLDLMYDSVPSGAPLKGIVVVGDSDDDPEEAFREVRRSISLSGLRAPDAPLEILTNNAGRPATAVMLVPWHDRPGNLELLLLNALKKVIPAHLIGCLEAFRDCSVSGGRTESLQAKMLLRCLITVLHPTHPSQNITNYLKQAIQICPINYASDDFNQMADFLAGFSQRVLRP